MKLKTMPLTSSDYVGLRMECTAADKLSDRAKRELMALLNTSYADWSMEELFDSYPSQRHLYVYRLYSRARVVASRQVLVVKQNHLAPAWAKQLSHTLNIETYAIGSRAIVHPDYRNQGIGSRMVSSINERVFVDHDLDVMLGSSTSLGAIALYLRMGANLWREDIDSLPFKNEVEQKEAIFVQLLKNPELRLVRFNQPLRYLYHRDVFPSSWVDYLWSNEIACTSAMIANTKIAAESPARNGIAP